MRPLGKTLTAVLASPGIAAAVLLGSAGTAAATTHTNVDDGDGLPIGIWRMPGGNSGAVCVVGALEGDLPPQVRNLISDRRVKTDVVAVDWSR